MPLTQVVLLDEVHNLVRPSAEILRNEKRMLMLMRLRQLLRTAEKCAALAPRSPETHRALARSPRNLFAAVRLARAWRTVLSASCRRVRAIVRVPRAAR
jgi:hypothetical protein